MTQEMADENMDAGERLTPPDDGPDSADEKKDGGQARVLVNRHVHTQLQFNELYHSSEDIARTCCDVSKSSCRKTCCQCSRKCWQQAFLTLFPFVQTFSQYKLKYLPSDIIAGLSVGIIHIPQGLGFALLTSVPPVNGLYSSFWPVIFYFMFGTSRHNSLGTMAVISLIIGAAVDNQMASKFPDLPENALNGSVTAASNGTSPFDADAERVKIAVLITFLAGLIQLAMGICRLGLVTILMPMSFVSGFTTAAAFHISTSQIKHLFGLKVAGPSGMFRLPLTWYELARNLPDTNPATIVITIIALLLLVVLKEIINVRYSAKLKMPVPAELLVVVTATVCSYLINVKRRYDVILVGEIPRGIPAPVAPTFENSQDFIADAFIVAILSFTISISMAKLFGSRYQYPVDGNKELVAYGLTHTLSSFFHCFAGASAPPRCFVYDSCGGKTSVAHLFSCALVLLIMLALGPYFSYLPSSILGCVIIVALFPLFKQFTILKLFWRVSKIDFAIWLVTWTATVFLDVGIGLGVGIVFVLLSLVIQAFGARGYELSSTPDADLFYRVDQFGSHEAKNIFIFRYEHNLNFTTVQRFQQLFTARLGAWMEQQQALREKHDFSGDSDGANQGTWLRDGDVDLKRTSPEDPHQERQGSIKQDDEERGSSDQPIANGSVDGNGVEKSDSDDLLASDSGPVSKLPQGAVIIDAAAFTSLDVMAINTLRDVSNKLRNHAQMPCTLALANCGTSVQATLKRADLVASGDEQEGIAIYPTLQDAVAACEYRQMSLLPTPLDEESGV